METDRCLFCKYPWDEHNEEEYKNCVKKLTGWLDKS